MIDFTTRFPNLATFHPDDLHALRLEIAARTMRGQDTADQVCAILCQVEAWLRQAAEPANALAIVFGDACGRFAAVHTDPEPQPTPEPTPFPRPFPPADPFPLLYADRCVCGAPRADAVYCMPCREGVERLIAFAQHKCLSCGDASPTAICAACREAGWRIPAFAEPAPAWGVELQPWEQLAA